MKECEDCIELAKDVFSVIDENKDLKKLVCIYEDQIQKLKESLLIEQNKNVLIEIVTKKR